jgi:hypothetical protein
MFKENRKHQQPYLISNVNDLPEKQRRVLDASWAGAFYREFYSRLDERPFAVLYVNYPSRPNAPVNELVSLEYLKAANGWTDEEMYHHYLFDVQTRYALGLHRLGEAHFEMRTVYNFRAYLSVYMQETGINLLDQAFEQVTDEQLDAFRLKTGKQRTPALAAGASVDSTLVASNIRQMGRVQLLVEVLPSRPSAAGAADALGSRPGAVCRGVCTVSQRACRSIRVPDEGRRDGGAFAADR